MPKINELPNPQRSSTGAERAFCVGRKQNDMILERRNDDAISAFIGKLAAVLLLFAGVFLVAGRSYAADPDKVIHSVFEAADDGFDMVRT